MNGIKLHVMKEPGFEDLPVPRYQSSHAAGMDLHAAVNKTVFLKSGEYQLISTGIRVSIPPGYEGQVRPRSGLASKHGIGILNAPGTIDADYRGVVGVILFNFGQQPFKINRGDRIAQLVITRAEQVHVNEVNTLDKSDRNTGGFGSTGI